MAKLPTFRDAYAKRRAIVPVQAFYEWKREPDQPKVPFAIARADGSPLALAGLWEGWKGADGEVVRTFCLLTTEANRTDAGGSSPDARDPGAGGLAALAR